MVSVIVGVTQSPFLLCLSISTEHRHRQVSYAGWQTDRDNMCECVDAINTHLIERLGETIRGREGEGGRGHTRGGLECVEDIGQSGGGVCRYTHSVQ